MNEKIKLNLLSNNNAKNFKIFMLNSFLKPFPIRFFKKMVEKAKTKQMSVKLTFRFLKL